MPDTTDSSYVLELAADLTVAWLSNPSTKITANELPAVITKIYGALASLSGPAAVAEAAPEYLPAVTVRRSLASADHIVSLIDGKPYKMLKRHLSQNGLTPAEYRTRYGLKPDYPMVAESYSEKRRNLAKKIGLGRKPGESPVKAAKLAAASVAAASPAAMPAAAKAAAKPAAKPRARRAATAKAPVAE